jgi:tetratricopeptide (TPR) repeat protein
MIIGGEIPSNNNFYLHQRFSYLLRNPLSNFSLVVSLAFLGLMVTFKDYRRQLLLYAFLLGMTGSVLLFYNVSRFRIPAVPFFLLFSSVGAYALCNFILSRQFVKSFLAVVLIVGLLFYLRAPDIQKIRRNDYGLLYDIYDKRIRKYLSESFPQEALRECEAFMEVCPDHTSAKMHNNLGITYKEMGLNDKAIQEFTRVLQLENNSVEAYVNLGSAYVEKGLYDKALEYLKQAKRLEPNRAEVYVNLGSIYLRRGDYDDAMRELKKAVALKPDLWKAYKILALIYNSKKLYRDSIKACEKVLELQPNNFNVHEFLASVYLKVKVWNKARYHFMEALRLKPDHPRAEEIKAMVDKLSQNNH